MAKEEEKPRKHSSWNKAYDLIFDEELKCYKIVSLEYNLDNKDAVVTKIIELTPSFTLAVNRMERLMLAKLTGRTIKEKWYTDLTQKENK